MKLRWLLRKEVTWTRHQILPLVFVLILLPAAGAYGALGFQHVLPEDTPMAVVPANDDVTDDDIHITVGAITAFSEPVRYESREKALEAMDREEVYGVLAVPPDLKANVSEPANFTLYTDGDMVPYRRPSQAVAGITQFTLRSLPFIDRPIRVEHVELGTPRTLSEYLVPTFVMLLVMILAFAYLPYALARESEALDRVRFEASLGSAVVGKLALFTVLLVVPLLSVSLAGRALGYGIDVLAPGTVLAILLSFLFMGAFAAAVMLFARFSAWGRLVNLATMLFAFAFTGVVYPVGFFSVVRREIVRLVPTHYAMILVRTHALRELGVGSVLDYYGLLLATTAVAFALLGVSVWTYERGA